MEMRKTEVAMGGCIKSDVERVVEENEQQIEGIEEC